MHCPRCDSDCLETNYYCDACGSPLKAPCAHCGHVNRIKSRFCGQCSTPLAPAKGATATAPENVLGTLSATGGERKRVTLLFADIRDSTSLVDMIDPELAMQRLKPVLSCMREAVERYDGIVSRTQGDGIMAFFGAPRPHEDHAVRACLAALHMRDAVVRLGDPLIKIRVGIHTGEVVVQAVSNTLYQTYDAAGANVHLASRTEQLAEDNAILLTAETFAASKQFVRAQSIGEKSIRGLSQPVEMFRLLSVRHAPASELFRGREHLSPLSGRERDFDILQAGLASTIDGDGRVIGVVGEAGVGKSRLCFEFAESCRRQGIRVYEARVLAYGAATPLQPVLELLREFFGVRTAQSAEEARGRVIKALLASNGDVLPLVLEFLGLADPAQASPKLDPVVRKLRLIEVVRSIARSHARDRATIVLIEDLHWIDQASAEFVEWLADSVVGTTTMLLLNFRPTVTAPWMQRTHYRQITLSPLDRGASDDLLRNLLGEDASLASIRSGISERAQGNPFFIEELVNSLIERGDIDGTRGAFRLTARVESIPLPATVEAVLAARIDRLASTARQVLQSAAVIGREVPLSILERITEFPTDATAEALWQLRQAELLNQLPATETVLHAFRHPLIREVAYASMLQERRRKLHLAVAQFIEAQPESNADEQAGLLAYHLEQAGERLKAAQANMRAAIWVGANDASQALRSWRKVLELLASEPPGEASNYLRMFACGQSMNFGWREGMSAEEARGFFETAKDLAVAMGNLRANALIHAAYGRILAATGSADTYVAKVREAQSLIGAGSDPSLEVTLSAVLCHALRLAGRMPEALQINGEAMQHAHEIVQFDRKMLGIDVELWLAVMRGQILVTLGRFDEARPFLDRVLQPESDRGDLTHHVASVAYVDLAWAQGDDRLAEHHAVRALSMATKSGSPYVFVHAQTARGLAQLVRGHAGQGARDLEHALSFARERKAGLEIEARILADLANARRLAGDREGALQASSEAIHVACLRCARVPHCLAHIVRGLLFATAGACKDAQDELARAEVLIAETGAGIYARLMEELRAKLRTAP
jgi:predicted ATPase/class 3 adenylate cyclase